MMNPILTLTPFKNQIPYDCRNKLTFIAFDPFEGHISEFSENFLTLMGLANQRNSQSVKASALRDKLVNEKLIRITDILIDFDLNEYNYKNPKNYEEIHQMDLSCCKNTILKNDFDRLLQVRVSIRIEESTKEDLRVGYAIILLEDERFD